MIKQKIPKHALCLDWETTGIDWNDKEKTAETYQGISYGAVIFEFKTFEPVATLYREIKFDVSRYKWTEGAEKVHKLSKEHLEKNGISREEAACDLIEFLEPYFGIPPKLWFLGHNPDFDLRITTHFLKEFGLSLDYNGIVLDTATAGMMTLDTYKSEALFQKLGFGERGAHNALEDALLTVRAAQAIRLGVQSALGLI